MTCRGGVVLPPSMGVVEPTPAGPCWADPKGCCRVRGAVFGEFRFGRNGTARRIRRRQARDDRIRGIATTPLSATRVIVTSPERSPAARWPNRENSRRAARSRTCSCERSPQRPGVSIRHNRDDRVVGGEAVASGEVFERGISRFVRPRASRGWGSERGMSSFLTGQADEIGATVAQWEVGA